ncbi:hypothetical protein G5I_12066 [Acromyrmex echinatior]|uniref:Uncharacterized protein n=1 Tax=Acromyrmex echinatior TaxID=103372 RepID=F4X1A7_ACREC|nr:hypothetical protein G5I_12066 [Acromyrmex echinatior]
MSAATERPEAEEERSRSRFGRGEVQHGRNVAGGTECTLNVARSSSGRARWPPHATTPASVARSQCPDKKRCPLKLLRAKGDVLPTALWQQTGTKSPLADHVNPFISARPDAAAAKVSHGFDVGHLIDVIGEKGRPRTTSMSMLKRYQNQSIICNNGLLKTTFHKLPPGGHVVSPVGTSASFGSWVAQRAERAVRASFRKGVYMS